MPKRRSCLVDFPRDLLPAELAATFGVAIYLFLSGFLFVLFLRPQNCGPSDRQNDRADDDRFITIILKLCAARIDYMYSFRPIRMYSFQPDFATPSLSIVALKGWPSLIRFSRLAR